jgi:hypothetical protein
MLSIITNQRNMSSQPKTKPNFLLHRFMAQSSIINILFTAVMSQHVECVSRYIHVNLVGKNQKCRIVAMFVTVDYFRYKVCVCMFMTSPHQISHPRPQLLVC